MKQRLQTLKLKLELSIIIVQRRVLIWFLMQKTMKGDIWRKRFHRVAHGGMALLLIATFILPFIKIEPASAGTSTSAGPRTATATGDCTEDTSVGVSTWTNPGNAFSDNATNATVSTAASTLTRYLKCLNYGFSIPSGARVDGIQVSIQRSAGTAGRVYDNSVRLVKGGTISGDNKADLVTFYPTTETAASYGSGGDLWGLSWAASDINGSTFGVVLSAQRGSGGGGITASVDVMTITVYYTTFATLEQSSYRWFENQDVISTYAQSWGGNTNSEWAYGITSDTTGNMYVVGGASSSNLTSGGEDQTLVKYNSSGVEQWSKTWGGDSSDRASDVALDTSGNIYVVGTTLSTGFTAGNLDQTLVKYNSSGVEQWSKTLGGTASDEANALALDTSGNIYVVGVSSSTGLSTIGSMEQTLVKYNSSGVEQWTKTWGGTGSDIAYDVALDASGNIFVVGQTNTTGLTSGNNDQTLVKYDSSGVEQWSKTWGGTGSEIATSLTLDTSGNIYVAGYAQSTIFTGSYNEDQTLVKYNSSGVEQWSKTWGDSGTERTSALALDTTGNIYVGGFTDSAAFTSGNEDQTLVKYNSSGVEQWSKTWGDSAGYERALDVWADTSGNISVVGYSSIFSIGSYDQTLLKFSTNGNITNCSSCVDRATSETDVATSETDRTTTETDRTTTETDRTTSEVNRDGPHTLVHCGEVGSFFHTWGSSGLNENAYNLTNDSSGNIYVVGSSDAPGSGNYAQTLVKYNSAGVEQWSNRILSGPNNRASAVAVDSSGNIFVAGTGLAAQPGPAGTDSQSLIKYNSSGVEQWVKYWGGDTTDWANDIILDSSGNIYTVGYTSSTGLSSSFIDQTIVKYNSSGVEQWSKSWTSTNGDDIATSMAMDSSGNIYVVGYIDGFGLSGGAYEQSIVKYNSSGVEQWSKTWGDASTGVDIAQDLVLDSSGNIYVAGYSNSTDRSAGSYDQTLVKYNSSGVEQWSKTWGGTGDDRAYGLTVDTTGNLYIVGFTASTDRSVGSNDQTVVKYNPSGVEQWSKTWGGTGDDQATKVLLVSNDKLYVSGFTASTGLKTGTTDQTLFTIDTSGDFCSGICTDRAVSETDRTVSETDRTVTEVDRTVTELDGSTPETGLTRTEVVRNEAVGMSSIDVGSPLNSVAQNTATTAPVEGTGFRLRFTLHVTSESLLSGDLTFKLQYAARSGTCDTSFTGETYADVGSGTPIAYYDNPIATDGLGLVTNANDPVHSTHTNIYQEYQESGTLAVRNTTAVGEDGLWDIALKDNGAPAYETYCFRIVTSSDAQLGTYTVIPQITVKGPNLEQSGYRWFNNKDNTGGDGTFAQSWGGSSIDTASDVTVDSSGNIYLVGATFSTALSAGGYDQTLVKYNSSGVEQWTKTWGGTSDDFSSAVAVDSSGNIYVSGMAGSTGLSAGGYDQTLVKYNSSGVEQWSKTWGGTSNDAGQAIEIDSSGNIYTVGYASSTGLTAGGNDQTLVKYDSSGVEQWSKTWGGTIDDMAYALTLDSSGNIYVAGTTQSSGFTAGGYDQTLVKYNSSGVEQWSKTWGGTGDEYAYDVKLDSSANIYVAGYTNSTGFTAGGDDQTLVKYDSSGVEQWSKTLGGTGTDRAQSLVLDSSGNIYIAGYSGSTGLTSGSSDQTLVKYNSSGVEQWSKSWGGGAQEIAYSVFLDSTGYFYVAGYTESTTLSSGSFDQSLLRFANDGTISSCASCVDRTTSETDRTTSETNRTTSETDRTTSETDRTTSETNRDSPQTLVHCGSIGSYFHTWGGASSDIAYGVALDSTGNIYTVGSTASAGFTAGSDDQSLVKYDSSGVEQWSKTWGGTSFDGAYDIAVDSSGNIYTVGYTNSTGLTSGNNDQTLVKYNSSGVEQWSKTWGGSGTDQASAIAVDSSGNIYTAGSTNSTGFTAGSTDQTLVKYNSSGVEQWSKTWGGTGTDSASGIKVDTVGNIYVAGRSNSTGLSSDTLNGDLTVVKYDSSGVEQWSKSWGGSDSEYANDIELDSAGNLYIAGGVTSTGYTAGVTDQVLIKFDSSGAEQWTKTWGGSTSDYARALSLDAVGNIYTVGYSESGGLSSGFGDQTLVKYNSSGVEQWSMTWGGSDQLDGAHDLALNSSGMIYVVGSTASAYLTAGSDDQTLFKTSSISYDCGGLCTIRTTSETDRAVTEVDRTTSEVDRTTSEVDRTTSEVDRTTTEVVRNETADIGVNVGDPLAAVNTSATLGYADLPIRLRFLLHASGSKTATSGQTSSKLQYAARVGTCDTSFTGESYVDVSASTSLRYYDNVLATDGLMIAPNLEDPTHSGHNVSLQYYEESNNMTNRTSISSGNDYMWDFSLTPYEAVGGSYCFRVVESDGSLLYAYSQIFELSVPPSTSQQMRHGNYFDAGGTKQPFYW